MSHDSTTSCRTHVDVIVSTLGSVSVRRPQTVNCGDGLRFTEAEEHIGWDGPIWVISLPPSVRRHWFPLQLGRHPLLWPAGRPSEPFKRSDELSTETLEAVWGCETTASCAVAAATLHRRKGGKRAASGVTADTLYESCVRTDLSALFLFCNSLFFFL